MTVYARTRWPGTLLSIFMGVWAPAQFDLRIPGMLAVFALAAVAVVVTQRMRFSADDSGVTVVNLLRARRIPWPEIGDFRLEGTFRRGCLEVCKRDGTRVRAWVVTPAGLAAYPRARLNSLILDLRQRLMLANGWSQHDLDAHAVEVVLADADRGEYLPSSMLVADGRVEAQLMAEKLIQRAQDRS
jgi:hypothetical protein